MANGRISSSSVDSTIFGLELPRSVLNGLYYEIFEENLHLYWKNWRCYRIVC